MTPIAALAQARLIAGGNPSLARRLQALGVQVNTNIVEMWCKAPHRYALLIAEATGVHPFDLRPELGHADRLPQSSLRAAALPQGDGCRASRVRGQVKPGVNSDSRSCASPGSGRGDLVRTMPSLGVSSLDLPRRDRFASGLFGRRA
jgi:hypothetical protein